MLRACGADAERAPWSAARCWCGGLFCGKGGYKATREFRREFRATVPALSRAQFDELTEQADLFDGLALREKWIERLDRYTVSAARRSSSRAATANTRNGKADATHA